jgi:putative PIN family toxin of toxin-antitoxin system
MRVCLDTNVLLQLFGRRAPFAEIKSALLRGRLELAVSNEIPLEYEEVFIRLGGSLRWHLFAELLAKLAAAHGTIIRIEPQFRFRVIATDADDNKFIDCAIAAQADYIVTEDRAFAALRTAGYQPQPISPAEFIARHLAIAPPAS